jgi:hypothetical protein
MLDELQLHCEDPTRRALLLADPKLNGIDAVEVPWDDQLHPRVYFVKDDCPTSASAPTTTASATWSCASTRSATSRSTS